MLESTIKNEYLFYKKNKCFMGPKTVQIEVTNRCPLNCPQCYKDYENQGDMSIEDFKRHIDDAKEIGVHGISIIGGEPMIHKDIKEIIKYACENNMQVALYTSGIKVDEEFIEFISKYERFNLMLSLNGSTKEVNSKSRDGYDITLNALALCKEKLYKFGINWVARKDNVDDLENVIKLALDSGAKFVNLVCNKINHDGVVDSGLDREDYDKLISIYDKYKKFNILSIQTCFDLLLRSIFNTTDSGMYGCQAGVSVCSITFDNKYAPCMHLYYTEKFDSLKEYWRESENLKKLRMEKIYDKGPCSNCVRFGKCRFCRAMSKNTHDDFRAHLENCAIKNAIGVV